MLVQFDYAYDADSNPTSVTTPTGVETYGYDSRDRLTSVCYQSSCPAGSDPFIRWTYDDVGNRLTESRPSGTTNYTYDAADELTQAGSTSYTYDSNGNEAAAGARSFGWNIAGQLVSTTSGGSTTNYSYDGDGNRLQSAAATTTNYVWDVNASLPRLAIEQNGSGSSLRSYTYGQDLLSMLAGGQNYYFHDDAIGSVRNITSSTGQTEWTYSYEPFGGPLIETKNDTMAPDNTTRFTGELLDTVAGVYDLRARQYDATSGRFLSLDPLPGGRDVPYETAYSYSHSSPLRFVDPSGEGAVWPYAVLGACTGAAFAFISAPLPLQIRAAALAGYLSVCVGGRGIRYIATTVAVGVRQAPSAIWNHYSRGSWTDYAQAGVGCVIGALAALEFARFAPAWAIPFFIVGYCGVFAAAAFDNADISSP